MAKGQHAADDDQKRTDIGPTLAREKLTEVHKLRAGKERPAADVFGRVVEGVYTQVSASAPGISAYPSLAACAKPQETETSGA